MMKDIKQIREQIATDSTILNATEELAYMQNLMLLTDEDILNNLANFGFILDVLYHSHMDTFYAIDDSNYEDFKAFSTWLEHINLSMPPSQNLESCIEMFSIKPKSPYE